MVDNKNNNLILLEPIVKDITDICDDCVCESNCFNIFNFKCDNHKNIINEDDKQIQPKEIIEKK